MSKKVSAISMIILSSLVFSACCSESTSNEALQGKLTLGEPNIEKVDFQQDVANADAAVETLNIKTCDKVQDLREFNACQYNVAFQTALIEQSSSQCKKIQDPVMQESCINSIDEILEVML
jgi:hypothetical protein